MIRPPYLKKGDTIGIVAPASYITENEIHPAIQLFSSWGLKVVTGNNLYRRRNSFAGTDLQRTTDFQKMMDDHAIQCIVCARGGYGSIRIIGRLNFDRFLQKPKWIVGCSDITVFHAALQQLFGIESLHAIMPRHIANDGKDSESIQSLKEALFGEPRIYETRPHHLNCLGESQGILIGGNLSVLYSLRGSPYDPDTNGKILFLEDVNEYLYHIDRMIMNLKYCGKLDGLKGLVVGGMNGMKSSVSGFRKPAYQIIREAIRDYHYPVIFGAPSGHIVPNKSLVLGRHVKMHVDEQQCNLQFMS